MQATRKSDTLDIEESASKYPVSAKRTFGLTLDAPADTNFEAFWGLQIYFTAAQTGIPIVCVASGMADGSVNPIAVPFNGAVIAVNGVGIVSSGNDVYGATWTTTTNLAFIALAGNGVQPN